MLLKANACIAPFLFVVLLLPPVQAQARARPRSISASPEEPARYSNLPQHREPPAPAEVTSAPEKNTLLGQMSYWLETCRTAVARWYGTLSRLLPGPIAWTLLAAPIVLLFLGWLIVRRLRRRALSSTYGHRLPSSNPAIGAPTQQARQHSAAARGRKPSPLSSPKEEAAAPMVLKKAQEVLLAQWRPRSSVYETFLALGPDQTSVLAFRRALAPGLDAPTWAATVQDRKAERLRPVCLQWMKEVAMHRLAAWIKAHPLLGGNGLMVQIPARLEENELDSLTLTQANGLGIDLNGEQ